MATIYPSNLPTVPGDRWGGRVIGGGGDPDDRTSWIRVTMPAPLPEVAERRALAILDLDYEDDLRGMHAQALKQVDGGWEVRVGWPGNPDHRR